MIKQAAMKTKPVIQANQLPVCVLDDEIEWHVENIAVYLNRKTKKWRYELMWFDDGKQEWNSVVITHKEAKELCDVELPERFYQ